MRLKMLPTSGCATAAAPSPATARYNKICWRGRFMHRDHVSQAPQVHVQRARTAVRAVIEITTVNEGERRSSE